MTTEFSAQLAALMDQRGLGVRALARHVPCDPGLISRLASGHSRPSAQIAARLDDVLSAGGDLAALAAARTTLRGTLNAAAELAAVEAARRAGATDVGHAATERLEQLADHLALAYASAAPADLLARATACLGYTSGLLERKMTLREHRRLLVTTAWLSLLAATSLTDLGRPAAAAAHLRNAEEIAVETGHAELAAWVLETRAWQSLIGGQYPRAAALAGAAQGAAPAGSSAQVQATAQEGRAWARLGAVRETLDALGRVEVLVSPMPAPEHPEHHYQYDPAKAEAYLATTLAWIGDPAAEGYARSVLERIESAADGTVRPRRAATARLDLALALASSGRADEAAGTAREAIESGVMVPSHVWRAEEVISAVGEHDPAGAAGLRDSLRAAVRRPPALPQGRQGASG
jgi:tetratricopeptide (TPR) repeat protein